MPLPAGRRPWGLFFTIAFAAAFWAAFFALAWRQDAQAQDRATPTPDALATQVWAVDCCGTPGPECTAMLGTYRADFLKARLTQAALTATTTVAPTATARATDEPTPTFEPTPTWTPWPTAAPTPTRTRPRPTPTRRPAPSVTPTRSPRPTPCPMPTSTATPSPGPGQPAVFLPLNLKPRPPRRPTP